MSNPSITADKTPWYQWDTGLTVTVSGGAMNECHFANRKQGTAYVQAVINGVARVPDELLQVAAPIKVYGFVYDDAGGQTHVDQTFEVIARNIPSDYTYAKTIQKTIRDAEAARDEAVQAAKDAKASELAADDSAVEASNSAQSAGESASAAATSASNSAKSAGEAAKSASDAKAAASKTVEDASDLLKTYTDNAKTSADNAATSASNAADAASAASGSASAASTSASEAATSAQEAKEAAGNAASEVLAATKANADAAAQSATDAATANAEAEVAKSEAATSASNAAASAENAANSARAAANSVNSINVISPKTVNVSASSSDQFDIAIGQNAHSTANRSIAIGVSSEASHLSSIALGGFSTTSKDYEVAIGTLLENGADSTREITHVSEPTGPNSASTKKYTDDNDAKTLNEAKKYTDANTSNALVSTVSGKLLHVEDAWPGKPLGLTIDGAYKQDGTPSPENPVPITVVENPVLRVTGADTSAEGASIPITLPAEHPYLAALPDTTKDVLSIDKYGDVTLLEKVYKGDDVFELMDSYEEKANSADFQVKVNLNIPFVEGGSMSNVCRPGNVDQIDPVNGGVIKGMYVRMTRPETVTDLASAVEYLRSIGFVMWYKTTETIYRIGKIDIPSLPETISNVWTDAELTTNMSMTYKRDINIAFDNLAQAVVAAAAGE